MFPIKFSFDQESFSIKPDNNAIKSISMRIGHCYYQVKAPSELKTFIEQVAIQGHTFCPATFKNNARRKDNFEQQQIIALDFDNNNPDKQVSLDEVRTRAYEYGLRIVAAYDTFSSKNHNKFRVIFINDVSITDIRVIEVMQLALSKIFPEADPTCIKDVSKMYFGGKELLYYDDSIPLINIETVFRGLTYYYEDMFKNHYREKIVQFSKESGIALNNNGLLDILVSDEPFETAHLTETNTGASTIIQNGNFSPNANIIYIIVNGENFRNYRIGFCTNNVSVGNIATGNISEHSSSSNTNITNGGNPSKNKIPKNHKCYRSSTLQYMSDRCQLYRDFCSGTRKLTHDELFHLQLNMRNIESGDAKFLKILSSFPHLYSKDTVKEWKRHCKYNKQQDYHPSSCSKSGCPYKGECNHSKNIVKTVHPKRGEIERDVSFKEEYYSLEDAEQSMISAVSEAFQAKDRASHIIKAPCAIGKTTAVLNIMKNNPDLRILYAAPSNLLKDEIYSKALEMEIDICKTPSLNQIAYNLPNDVRTQIRLYYIAGQHSLVHPYIENVLKSTDIPCLREYLQEREKVQWNKGSLVTTHRYLMNMDAKALNVYDIVVIDEDLIYKSYISNQCDVPLSKLKEELKYFCSFSFCSTSITQLIEKIKELLERCKTQTYVRLNGFMWKCTKQKDDLFDDEFMYPLSFDISAFCKAEHFYIRRAAEDESIKEDSVVFIKPFVLKKANYIMLSATANEKICRQFFGKNHITFHECKQVKYQGNLYQFPGRSMSRSSIAANKGIVDRIIQKMGFNKENIITFANLGIGLIHFGNTDGLNTLEGEDVLVIGTPYHPSFLYKLVAHNLGFAFDENGSLSSQYITYNGYKIWFTTFKDENLRAILFWMLESELEQAVGRARLPRNDCNVFVFSNLPLKQAIMKDFDYS